MTAHDSALVEKAAAALRLVVAYRELYAVPTLENTTNPSMVSRVPSDQTPQWRYRNYVTTVLDAVADDLRAQGAAAALRVAAHDLPAFTEGANREGTAHWKLESARDTYSGAIEDACGALTALADSIEAGEQL